MTPVYQAPSRRAERAARVGAWGAQSLEGRSREVGEEEAAVQCGAVRQLEGPGEERFSILD